MFRLAIPAWSDEGLDAKVHPRPLGAPFMIIVDLEDKEIREVHAVRNPVSTFLVLRRDRSLVSWLKHKRVDVLIAPRIENNMIEKLDQWGINAFIAEGGTVRELLDKYLAEFM